MKVKLRPVPPKYKIKYVITVKFMHGDADAYTSEDYECANEADFIRVMSAEGECPEDPGAGGDEDAFDEWCTSMFGEDFVPGDCTCDCQVKAAIRGYEGFYYDITGKQYYATIV